MMLSNVMLCLSRRLMHCTQTPNPNPYLQVRLLAPGRWATVWRYALPPREEPLTLAVLRLRDMVSGATHPLVAVGTCLPLGEVRP